MPTAWNTLEILRCPTASTAQLVLVAPGVPPQSERIRALLERSGFSGERGTSLDLVTGKGTRELVLGTGSLSLKSERQAVSLGGLLVNAMTAHHIAAIEVPDCEALESILLGALLHGFQLERGGRSAKAVFRPQALMVSETDPALIDRVRSRADAINRARAWVERPANLLTPPVWADEVREVFEPRGARVAILGPTDLEEIAAGALLAVGRGSEHGAHLVIVEWRGDPSREGWDAVWVGKGLTFDAGGLNLKSRPGIGKMKLDMAGGAAVLGALELAMHRRARANIVAMVPMAENVLDARAFRPGDVLTSLSGLTIEVSDTDAEGRLVLADALTYGIRTYAPAWVIDAATLTTAITGVLHEEFAGLYASNDQLAQDLAEAGAEVGERLWRLPLDPDQDYLVESGIADLSNLGVPGFFGKGEGSPTAGALFLQRFTRGARWAHIDLCGTAWASRGTPRSGKGATGYGVALLDRWLSRVERERAA